MCSGFMGIRLPQILQSSARGSSGRVPVAGRGRPKRLWVVLLLYGGGVMDDLPLLERRGVRRVFGWTRVPHPATFGRW